MAMTAHHHGEKLRTSWVWMALFGVISLVGGFLALVNPLAATLAATVLAGWVFTLLGVLQVIQAFRIPGWPGFIWSLLFGILALAVGLSLVSNPLAGMVSLTLLVAVLFLVIGAREGDVFVLAAADLRLGLGSGLRPRLGGSRRHDPRQLPVVRGRRARHSPGYRAHLQRRLLPAVGPGSAQGPGRLDENGPLLWRLADLGLQRRGSGRVMPLQDRWPSVLQAELGERRARRRRGAERPHHRFRRSSGGRGPQRRAPAADDPDQPCAARPGDHHARRQRHEAVDSRQRAGRQAGHAAADRHRARP